MNPPLRLTAAEVMKATRKLANPKLASFQQKFFRTEKGGYGEGDRFLGIKLPPLRALAREFRDLSLPEVTKLLRSPWHEDRLVALVILCLKYPRAIEAEQKAIFQVYWRERKFINNWDLVDVSVAHVMGAHLFARDRSVLTRLAKSRRLWDRRLAIIATFFFIRKGEVDESFRLAEKLIDDDHDLMHKAVGWTLREAGKRDLKRLENFLEKHAATMPRTALRYSIERMTKAKRDYFMGLRARPKRITKISAPR